MRAGDQQAWHCLAGRRAVASGMVNALAIKTAFPRPAQPCAAPEDSAEEDAVNELPGSKHTAREEAGLKAAPIPLAFEQCSAPVDRAGAELFPNVQLTGP